MSLPPHQHDHSTPEPGEPSARCRRLAQAARIARRVYLAALCVAIVWLLVAYHDAIAEQFEGARLTYVAAAGVASFGLIGLGSALWHSSLAMLGHPVAFRDTVLATARSLPARYVPLGVTYAASRIALLAAAGRPLAALTVTAGLEMIVSASVALAAGLALLGAVGALGIGPAWIAAALIATMVAVSPLVGGRAVDRLLDRLGVGLVITRKGYLRVLAWSVAYWTWAAVTFTLYMRAFPAADAVGSLEVAGAFMVAWAVGFLTVFAPQGIGVAELGLVALLASEDTGGIAVAAVFAGYRIVQAFRDGLAAVAGEIIAIRRARRGSAPKG